MRNLTRTLAALTVIGLAGGQAYGEEKTVVVGEAPVHAVPADPASPVEDNAPPNTLNSQYAAQSRPAPVPAPARRTKAVEGPSAPIAPRIIDAAGAFEAYMRKAVAIDAKFPDGAAVAKAMGAGSGYEFQQFQEGEAAYAALAALQDAGFVQGVYNLGRDPGERDAMAASLYADPAAVMQIDGADEAAAMVSGVLARMGADLVRAGQGVKQAAYEVQHQTWSKEDVPHADQRLAATKAQSAIKTSLSGADTDALIQSIMALRQGGAGEARRIGQPSPVVARGLAVAALAVLGRAGEGQVDKVAALLGDPKSADCMKMAKLNLYQCMAAAGPEYEDVFCLGAHAMIDTGQCVIAAAGQSPLSTEVQKVSAPVAERSVSIPIALLSTAGPERQAAARPTAPAQEERAAAAPPEARDYAAQDDYPAAYARRAPRDDRYDRGDSRYEAREAAPRRSFRDEGEEDAYGPPGAYRYYGR